MTVSVQNECFYHYCYLMTQFITCHFQKNKKSAIAHVHPLVFLPQVMIFQCLDCNRTFASASARKSHSRATGHDIPNCGLCDRMFVDQQALMQVSTRVRVDNGSQFPWNA